MSAQRAPRGSALALVAGALLVMAPGPARAQQPGGGMADLKVMAGKPLPVPELAPGTVSVRVSNKLPMNVLADVEVSAIFKTSSGETRKRTVKTGADGRAQFESLPAGATFQAETTVEGEHLVSSPFSIPAQGGIRVLLIAGLGAAPAEGEAPPFTLGAVSGKITAAADLAAGVLEIHLKGEDGRPLPGRVVQLGQARKEGDSALQVLTGASDASGVARFRDLATGDAIGYAAVIEHEGMRLGTEAFHMSADKGMRGDIRAIERTTDPSVLRFDNRSKIIITLGEDALELMEQLVFKNVSAKIFDPGPKGLAVALPEGAESAKEIEGGIPLEVRTGEGVVVRAPIPPNNAALFALQIRVGFLLLAHGSSRQELRQTMPLGLEAPFLLVPAGLNLILSAPGLRPLPDANDGQGTPVKTYEMPDVAPGGTLALTISGLPALDHTGRNFTAVLCLLLIVAAVVGARRPAAPGRSQAEAEKLAERREKLFAELVTLERGRREAAGTARTGTMAERRQELVTGLETVYRDLARREQGESPQP
jgi:hypothetical protein